jgi:hypothetical protein
MTVSDVAGPPHLLRPNFHLLTAINYRLAWNARGNKQNKRAAIAFGAPVAA